MWLIFATVGEAGASGKESVIDIRHLMEKTKAIIGFQQKRAICIWQKIAIIP